MITMQLNYLIENYYIQRNVEFNSCHCRDIIDNIIPNVGNGGRWLFFTNTI